MKHLRHHAGMLRKTVGIEWGWRTSGARHIEANEFDGRVEGIDEPLEHFEVDTEPVHQEQRCTSALAFPNVYPQTLAPDSDSTRFGLWPDRFCLHGVSFHFQLDSDTLSHSIT